MLPNDGRVVTNFIVQALCNKPLTIFGDGSQTRSFCYVNDLISGIILAMNGTHSGPINIGNPGEFTILELANMVKNKINPELEITFSPLPQDDPLQRKPVIDLAIKELNWKPYIELNEGLQDTIEYFKEILT